MSLPITATAWGIRREGFRQAAVVVEREFNTEMVHQGYIEPQNATALFDTDGRLTIWCSTQGSFGVRDQVAEILDLPLASVRVIPMEIGGGFGGKNGVYLEPLAALLSQKSGHKPVKMTMNYAEVLSGTGPTSGSYIRVKMGVDRNGRITAAEAYLAYEAGAYPGSFITAGMTGIFSPYAIENVLVDGYDVVVNKPHTAGLPRPGRHQRGFRQRDGGGRTVRKAGDGPAGIPPAERGQRRRPPGEWGGIPAHRFCGNARSGPSPPALQCASGGAVCGARVGCRLLGQLRR